jgi:hypothetical protein
MTIRIIYEDDVDWEPLIMRFVPAKRLIASKARRVAEYVRSWMDAAADANPDLWRMAKEWDSNLNEDGEIVAQCELIPEQELNRLAKDLSEAFPTLQEIRLGNPLPHSATITEFDWFTVPSGSVRIGKKLHDVASFSISFTPVTVGQFQEFLEATGYTPMPDLIEETPGYLIDHFQLNFGSSPKQVLFGVTYDDAAAFCEWANNRLPTDPELKHFFQTACLQGRKFRYSGECWTSTSSRNGQFVAWDGPYRKETLDAPDRQFRKLLPRNQYEFLEAPCFRVVK